MKPYVLVLTLAACKASNHAAPDAQQPDAAPDAGPDFCNATDPRANPVAIAATPEAGEQPYLDALATAQGKIRVEIYEMGYGGILDQLNAKAVAGLTVQVIMDQSEKSVNQKY